MSKPMTYVAFAPVIAVQLACFALTAPRLPEARGPRQGQAGQGPKLRLLILGDSSAAGVGVASQDQALAGQMVAALAPKTQVSWTLRARSGATARAALQMLGGVGTVDVAVTALGVNDVLRMTSARRFARAQNDLFQRLRQEHGAKVILASAVPPLGRFERFPKPLRCHFGARANMLDAALREVCHEMDAVHVPFDLKPDPALLAADGFHPGAPLYHAWGARMAGLALSALS